MNHAVNNDVRCNRASLWPPSSDKPVRIVLADGFLPSSVPEGATAVESIMLPAWVFDSCGRVEVRRALDALPESEHSDCITVLLTNHDLAKSGCASLFGHADTTRRAAVVSSFRIEGSQGQQQSRLAHVIAHELGHLHGLRHCCIRQCVMHQARDRAELDQRPMAPCGRCPQSSLFPRYAMIAAACIVIGLLFAGLDALGDRASLRTKQPFSCRPIKPSGRPATRPNHCRLTFNSQPVLDQQTMQPVECCFPEAAAVLNRLFLELTPCPLAAVRQPPDHAVVMAGTSPLLFVARHDANREDPLVGAARLALQLNDLLRAKGYPDEGCAACHVNRTNEVIRYSTAMKRGVL